MVLRNHAITHKNQVDKCLKHLTHVDMTHILTAKGLHSKRSCDIIGITKLDI